MSRRVGVVLTFFFGAESYVQKSCVVPMSSAGGVGRTGSKPFAGWPERPGTVRVSSNPFAYGSDFASNAAVMSRLDRVEEARGVGVLDTGVAPESVGEGLGVACGGTHAATRRTSARSASQRRRLIGRGTPRRGFASRRPGRRGNSAAGCAGGYRSRSRN